MKKNKILIFIFALVLTVSIIGCGPKKAQLNRTQTRVGMENPNNVARRNNVVTPNTGTTVPGRVQTSPTNDFVGRNGTVNPNLTTDFTRRDGVVNPNLTTDITRENSTMDMAMVNRARTIAQKVVELNEVDKANCLITGNTAIVGVDIKDNIKGQMTTELKRKIETKVKNTDNNIKYVAVTADPDLATRITTLARDIENGKPISGFGSEIQEILRRITPAK